MPRVSKKTEEVTTEVLEQNGGEHHDEGRKRNSTPRPRARHTETVTEATVEVSPSEAVVPEAEERLRFTTAQLTQEADALRAQFAQAGRQFEELQRQTDEARGQFLATRQERDQFMVELEGLRQQARTLQDQFLRDAMADAQRARKEASATEELLAEVKRLFQDTASSSGRACAS